MKYTKRFDEIGREDVALAGGKGANLGELSKDGLPVPPGFVLTTAAYDAFVVSNDLGDAVVELASAPEAEDRAAFERVSERIHELFSGGRVPEGMAREIRSAYGSLAGDPAAVAVRSSATAEDLAGASFAGQQETFLNVRGGEALADAVKDCWASLWTARAMAYRRRQGIAPDTVSLAVVVQEMIPSEASGVMFTANPANGRRNEAVISAAWGLGESVVGGSVTTDDLVVEKDTGKILSRQTADKRVMTVYTEGGVKETVVPGFKRGEPVLDDEKARELALYGERIEGHYGSPQDVEWALAGGEFFVVQSRPITALPEPTADPPTDWTVPYAHGLYFRASIVEQMPDPLTPLFADLIDGSVTRSLNALLTHAVGEGALRDGDVRFLEINGYAYYYYRNSAFLRTLPRIPRAIRTLFGDPRRADSGDFRGGVTGWRERSHPEYARLVGTWKAKDVGDLASEDLIEGVSELLDAGTKYYTAVQSIIPLAATGETLFRVFYDSFVRRPGDPAAHTFLLGFDSEPIRAEKSLYDLSVAAHGDPGLATALTREEPAALLGALHGGTAPAGADPRSWQRWRERFRRHLDLYGHAVYNLDFADPVPADDPSPLLDTIRFYLAGHGNDPHQRQQSTAERREAQTQTARARLDPVRRAVFDGLLGWAQEIGPVREDALADVGLAWPTVRRMLLEVGRRLVAAGVVVDPADVFWLRRTELRDVIGGEDAAGPDFAAIVERRRMLWRGRKQAVAPQMLPRIGWLERSLAGFMPAGAQEQSGDTITGVGASSGRMSGRARVLDGPADFGQIRPGEVLVARITTPAWTPLFAMASAVVTDIGGPLSHSSIVAREYGIPAVLGTGAATARIKSGQNVRVDGDAGTVTLLHGSGEPAAERGSPGDGGTSNTRRTVILILAAAAGAAWWIRRRQIRRHPPENPTRNERAREAGREFGDVATSRKSGSLTSARFFPAARGRSVRPTDPGPGLPGGGKRQGQRDGKGDGPG